MVTLVDKIQFQSVLSLIYGRYVGHEKEYTDFISELKHLSSLIDSIHCYSIKRRGKFQRERTSYYPVSMAIKSHTDKLLTKISNVYLKTVLDKSIANEVCDIYHEIIDLLNPFKGKIDEAVDSKIHSIETCFESLSKVFNNVMISSIFQNEKDRETKVDELIVGSLSSFLFVSFLSCEDYDVIYRSLMKISQRLNSFLQPHVGIMPEEIRSMMFNLPLPLYRGFCYYQTQSKNLGFRTYTELVTSIPNSQALFSRTIFDCDLYYDFSKYYVLFSLLKSLYAGRVRNHPGNLFDDSHFKEPILFIQRVKDFYSMNISDLDRTFETNKMAAFTVAIFNEVKSLFSNECLQLVGNLINSDDVIRERFSFYERVNQWHSVLSSVSDNATSQNTENSSVKLQSIQNGNIPAKEHLVLNQKFNCIIPEKDIDPFLEYLVWRGYLKEGDQASFKYDVFGGHKPSDYRDVSFNFNTQIVGSMMLGVIIWKLRKENDDPVRLYNKKVTQSNSQIGTGNNAMRVFVDFGLFFPSLVSSLKMKNSDFEPIKMRLIERVQDLSGSDEYKNSSSILEFIKQQEKKDRNYWGVSKKL